MARFVAFVAHEQTFIVNRRIAIKCTCAFSKAQLLKGELKISDVKKWEGMMSRKYLAD
ncbi:hypothetical protein D046_1711 [Vibrio parahaemolyticus V-223/04]|nr:hypothetical protein D046_1711 [Vibrio parahaemolyticus V-223/04]